MKKTEQTIFYKYFEFAPGLLSNTLLPLFFLIIIRTYYYTYNYIIFVWQESYQLLITSAAS